jgi:hypothetical protein
MARQHAVVQNSKSVVGAALIGLGIFILLRNAAEAASLIRSLRMVAHDADSLGILTAAAMAIWRTLQAYLFNHAEFLRTVYQVLVSFSVLLLIVAGTIFFAAVFEVGEGLKKKNKTCRFRCVSFDA